MKDLESQMLDMQMEGFKLLSYKQERELSVEEKKQYYEELRQYCLKRPLKSTTKGATTLGPKLRNVTSKIATSLTKVFSDKNVEWVCDGTENLPEGAAIFAHSHQGILDGFVWIPEIDRHCVILHGAEVNKLLLACQLNTGLILVWKGDKQNNQDVKLDMIRILCEGHSICYCPEGTWNLSPNKLLLPLSWGCMETACKAKVPVIPVVHEFTYDTSTEKERITKIHSRYGKPIYVTEEDCLKQKLEEYEEVMSTMRWELIEEKGLFSRKDVSNWEYINFLKGNYKNLALGKLNLDKERRFIFGGSDDFYKFHHVNDIPWDAWGNLLETDEVRKLKRINAVKLPRRQHNV